MTLLTLSRAEARRVAVRAQLLASPRPTTIVEVLDRLFELQNDPTAAVARSAHLVLWSRLGSGYSPADLDDLRSIREVVEYRGSYRLGEDIRLYTADMAEWSTLEGLDGWRAELREWVRANDVCRVEILNRIRESGPATSRELPDLCEVPWRSSGWNNFRNVRQLLGLMEQRGEVAVTGQRGRDRLWDLAERVYPDAPMVPAAEAVVERDRRRLRALGVMRSLMCESSADASDLAVVAKIDGVPGRWLVDPAQLDQLGTLLDGRTVLLSPLDRLVFDRKRTWEIFEFDYQLEMYKPVAQRRWGYWALPILAGDRLIGKLDATADRSAGVLRVDALHQDEPFDSDTTAAVDEEIEDLGRWLGLDIVRRG